MTRNWDFMRKNQISRQVLTLRVKGGEAEADTVRARTCICTAPPSSLPPSGAISALIACSVAL